MCWSIVQEMEEVCIGVSSAVCELYIYIYIYLSLVQSAKKNKIPSHLD